MSSGGTDMSRKRRTSLASYGDPQSELEIRRRVQFLRESHEQSGMRFVIDPLWQSEDPGLAEFARKAGLDWLHVKD